jgi:hypothetical protein
MTTRSVPDRWCGNWPRYSEAFAAVLAAALHLGGCQRAAPPASTEVGSCEPDEAGQRAPGGRDVVVMQHDFGVVRPKQECKHTFQVVNPTGEPWTFSNIQISCSCTTAGLSQSVIPSGGSAQVELTYEAISVIANDRRNVGIAFQEPALVCLEVSARIRDELSLSPQKVQSPRVSQGQKLTARFAVQNYARQIFDLPRVNCPAAWVAVGPIAAVDLTEVDQTQDWRVTLRVDTAKPPPGNHGAAVEVRGGHGGRFRCDLPVELTVAAPVELTPDQLFFGDIRLNTSATRVATVRVNDPAVRLSAEDFVVEHDLGDALRVEPMVTKQLIVLRPRSHRGRPAQTSWCKVAWSSGSKTRDRLW